MSTKRCYYETLEVDRTADESKLKAAFRKLAMKWHPDKNPGDANSEVRFKEINEAYEVLKDGDKRAAYDRFGHAAFEQGAGGGGPGFGAGFASSFSDIFEDLFGMAGQRGRGGGRERGADLRYNMEITLEEAFIGKTAQIEIPVSVTCESCSGTGAKAGTKPKTCSLCGGAGRVRQAQGFFTLERTCPGCQGRGQMIEDPCPSCAGSGRVTRERTLSVNIPQGVEDGTRIRLAGAPLASDRRHVCSGRCRNATEFDQEAAGIAGRVRKIVVWRNATRGGGFLYQGQGLLRYPRRPLARSANLTVPAATYTSL